MVGEAQRPYARKRDRERVYARVIVPHIGQVAHSPTLFVRVRVGKGVKGAVFSWARQKMGAPKLTE